jgi:hypothetical protein
MFKKPDYDLLYSPDRNLFLEWDSEDYMELTEREKDALIWLTWDSETGEWIE